MEDLTSAEKSTFIRTICETISDIVFFKSPGGEYLYVNSAFEQLYGYTLEQIAGKTDFSFLIQEEAEYFSARDKEAIDAGRSIISKAWQVNDLTGQRVCYETKKTPVITSDGRLLGVLGIVKNVTLKHHFP